MLEIKNCDSLKGPQPYFIYQRVLLTTLPSAYMFFTLDFGYWYLLREIHVKYPADNTLVQYPDLNIFALQKGNSKESQNVPIPVNLFCTPGSSGVQLIGAAITAGQMKAAKLQNIVYAFRDTMHFEISGHTASTPPFIDVCLIGYYLPEKQHAMWSGDNGID